MKDEELLEFGWAPGDYSVPPCEECERKTDPMDRFVCTGAKRSARCRTKAMEAYIDELKQKVAMKQITEFGELQTALEENEKLRHGLQAINTIAKTFGKIE